MLETQLLGGKFLSSSPRHWNRRRLRWADNFELVSPDLDVTGFHIRVAHFWRTCGNFALEHDYGLEAKLAGPIDHVGWRPLGIEGHLDEPGAVAKVEEDDSAKVSRSVYPTTEPDCGADVRRSELAA